MLPDRVSNPGPLTYESGALPIALRGPARSRFYRVSCLKELFDTVEPVRIFSFLKEIRLYNKI